MTGPSGSVREAVCGTRCGGSRGCRRKNTSRFSACAFSLARICLCDVSVLTKTALLQCCWWWRAHRGWHRAGGVRIWLVGRAASCFAKGSLRGGRRRAGQWTFRASTLSLGKQGSGFDCLLKSLVSYPDSILTASFSGEKCNSALI